MAADPVQSGGQAAPDWMSAFSRHVSIMHLLSLGYEHYDVHLRRLRPSLDVGLAWPDGQAEVAPGPWCIRRSALSRAVSFTDPFTETVRRLDRRFYSSSRFPDMHRL
jgi:hypothetical protein